MVIVRLAGITCCLAEQLQPIALPPPVREGGKPLMEALQARRAIRNISPVCESRDGLEC